MIFFNFLKKNNERLKPTLQTEDAPKGSGKLASSEAGSKQDLGQPRARRLVSAGGDSGLGLRDSCAD